MSQHIHYYPGHMAKSIREIEENISLVDLVIEILDARAPLSSRNPQLLKIKPNIPRIILLTKKDLADDIINNKWLTYFLNQGHKGLICNLKRFNNKLLIDVAKDAMKEKFEKERLRGLRPRPIRAMVVGIPNVGKSTLINSLARKKAARVGNKPGVTRSQQWIKAGNDFELLDTPGVLWPNLEDQKSALNLALIGSIKEEVLPLDFVTRNLLFFLNDNYKELLINRYGISMDINDEVTVNNFLNEVGLKRGILKQEGISDIEAVSKLILREFRDGIIGNISLEEPN